MKKILSTYKALYSTTFNLVMLVGLPAILIVLDYLIASTGMEQSRLDYFLLDVNAFFILTGAIFGDYYSLNGVVSKELRMGVIRSSSLGRKFIKREVITDIVRHLVQCLFLMGIAGACLLNFEQNWDVKEVVFSCIFTALITFTIIVLSQNLIRYIMMMSIYAFAAFGFVGVGTGFVMGFCIINCEAPVNVYIGSGIMTVIAVVVSIITVIHMGKKYDSGFGRKELC